MKCLGEGGLGGQDQGVEKAKEFSNQVGPNKLCGAHEWVSAFRGMSSRVYIAF